MSAYFATGNSNTFATIDLNKCNFVFFFLGAYTGLNEYNQIIVGLFVSLILYVGPLMFLLGFHIQSLE
jgi:hypothetical protein